MKRPRKPVPISIVDLYFNPQTGKYEISEMGVTYQMDLEHTRNLKQFFQGILIRGYGATIADWYNKLDHATKKEIIRIGTIQTNQDFYPDISYED